MYRQPTSQWTVALIAVFLAAAPFGCDREQAASAGRSGGANGAAPLAGHLLLADPPPEPLPVAQLKQSAAEGDAVVLRGVIGGRVRPIVAGRAIMTVVDAGMANQCKVPGDHCKTPWDYCCASREELQQNMATIQVLDADGNPLAADLAATPGLEPMAVVTIEGSVGPRPDPGALIINATGIFIEPSP